MVFAIDGTTSVDWIVMLNFVADMTKKFIIDSNYTRVGVTVFTDSVRNPIYLGSYTNGDILSRAISAIPKPVESSITDIRSVIETAMKTQFVNSSGDRPTVPDVLVVITDGASNVDKTILTASASNAWRSGIRIIAVGVGNAVKSEEIIGISSPPQMPNHDYWLLPTLITLEDLIPSLTNSTCEGALTSADQTSISGIIKIIYFL